MYDHGSMGIKAIIVVHILYMIFVGLKHVKMGIHLASVVKL